VRIQHVLASIPLVALVTIRSAAPAHAAEGTEIASAMDEDDPFDLFITVDYTYEAKRAAIKREYAGLPGSTVDGAMPIVKDLLYFEDRHTITPRLQVGLFHDLEIHAALPIVVSDSRHYDFDQRETNCDFTGDDANCINQTNSSTFRDGLLGIDANGHQGYDAGDPATNFMVGGKRVFNGVDRSGLDQIFVGLGWAPLNQERDDTKPTWVLDAEFRLAVGSPMRFDRNNPSSEASVGRGLNEIHLSTSISKRTAWAEPFVSFYWQSPLSSSGSAPPVTTRHSDGSISSTKADTQFWNVGFGQDSAAAQQIAGTTFGFNGIPWQNPKQKQFLMIEVRGKAEAHFEGRGYSEMWEIFALGGDVTTNPDAPLGLDRDPVSSADAPLSHPGVTTIENYLTFGGRLGLRGQMGDRAKFNASFELDYDQAHRISWTDAGKELPGCTGGATSACETPNDNVVTPGTKEVNPLFSRAIDLPGRRYLVDESVTYALMLSGTLMF
jgi:hypothetical protein